MTTLDLTALLMAPVSDLSDIIELDISSESDAVESPARVRRYAGGRDRVISTPGETRTISITARNVDRDTYLDLLDRVGVLQLFREPRGRRTYGIIQQVNGDEWVYPVEPVGDVMFSYTSVTESEVV
jgi:hypothetical protein